MATDDEDRYGFIFSIIISSIPVIYSAYFLISTVVFIASDPLCDYPLLQWDLKFGIFLLVLSIVGLIGVLCRAKAPQIACLTVLGIVILFILVISWNIELGGTDAEDPKRIDSAYRLENYAPWAVKFLLKHNGWADFQNCLKERNVCDKKLNDNHFFEDGCCAPPMYCGFQQKNQSWVIPESGLYAEDTNCVTWSSDKTKLCHNCETCQAVYVYVVTYNWHLRGVTFMFGILIWASCLCITYEYEKRHRHQRRNRIHNVDEIDPNIPV